MQHQSLKIIYVLIDNSISSFAGTVVLILKNIDSKILHYNISTCLDGENTGLFYMVYFKFSEVTEKFPCNTQCTVGLPFSHAFVYIHFYGNSCK